MAPSCGGVGGFARARGLCSHILLVAGAAGLTLLLAWPGAAQARRAPSYHSPGYAGTKRLPKVAPVPPPRPVFMAADGHSPHVLVDAGGTAHLAWSEDPNDAPGIMHYCRFPRGSS